MKTSVLLPAITDVSTVAIDFVVSPNNLRFCISKKFASKVLNFKLFSTYQLPAEALSTASLVKNTSKSEL